MPRSTSHLTLETLVEEGRFILKTLLRDDLFGDRVRLTEAERVLDKSISLSFADYCGFLSKFGYVHIDKLANVAQVTEDGQRVARTPEDNEFSARLTQHFSRALGNAPAPRKKEPPPPPPMSMAPPRRLSDTPRGVEDVLDRRYRRGAAIGSGPTGDVFEATHISLGRRVAVKEARSVFLYASYLKRDEIVRRFRAAVQNQAQLDHPHVLQVVDLNTEREYPYVATELAAGGNLRQRLAAAEDGRLPVNIAVRVLLQICYALRNAHSQGVLHLGLKPENVLFDARGNVKLADFGLSTVTDREESASQIPVLVGSGTVPYMSPERLQPDSEQLTLGPSADIYAVGILCYQMLTGKLPGRRSPMPSAVRKTKEVPASFDDVFDKMTCDDVEDRYKAIEEVLAGVYKSFPAKDVHTPGTILVWAADPSPLPEPEAEDAPEPEAVEEAASNGDTKTNGSTDEAKTGEVEVGAFQEEATVDAAQLPAE